MQFIKKHPRMSYLITGLAVGALMALLTASLVGGQADIYKEQLKRSELKYERLEKQLNVSQKQVQELNKQIKESYEEITKPDGTKIVRSKKDHSEKQRSQFEYEAEQKYKKIAEEKLNLELEKSGVKKKLNLNVGMNSRLQYYGSLNYNITSTINLGGTVVQDGTIGFHIGIKF